MKKWELIKQIKLLNIKSKILSNFFNESTGASWKNLTTQLGLKGLNSFWSPFSAVVWGKQTVARTKTLETRKKVEF